MRCDPSLNPEFLGLSGAGLDLVRDIAGVTVAGVLLWPDLNTGTPFAVSSDDNMNTRVLLDESGNNDQPCLSLATSNDEGQTSITRSSPCCRPIW